MSGYKEVLGELFVLLALYWVGNPSYRWLAGLAAGILVAGECYIFLMRVSDTAGRLEAIYTSFVVIIVLAFVWTYRHLNEGPSILVAIACGVGYYYSLSLGDKVQKEEV